MDFTGRVALITGGTRGIGAAISRDLLAQGCRVAAVYATNDDAAHAFVRSVGHAQERLRLHRVDIADSDACRAVVAEVVATCGRLDDRAAYVTGSIVTVDGGLSMGG